VVGSIIRELIGVDHDIHLAIAVVYACDAISGWNAIDCCPFQSLWSQLLLLATQSCELLTHIGFQIPIEWRQRHLSAARLTIDRHSAGTIQHIEALRRGESQPQLRVNKGAPFDDPLLRVISINQAIDPI